MTPRDSRWIVVVGSLAFITAVGVTVAVLTALGITFQGEGSAQPAPGSQYVGGALLTANRERLAICVETVASVADSGLEQIAVSTAQEALKDAAANASWQKNGLSDPAPVVEPQCPSPPSVFLPNAEPIRTGRFGLLVEQAPEVLEASYYRVFVFIVSPEELAATFGKEYPIATQEWLRRSADQSIPVTLGLYVTPSQASAPDYLTGWLLFMIGGVASPPQTGTTAP